MNIEVEGLYNIQCNTGSIYTLKAGLEPHLFYSEGENKTLIEWNLLDPYQNRAIAKFQEKIFAIEVLQEQQLLWVGNFAGGIHIIDLAQKKELKLLQLNKNIIFDISYLEEKNQMWVLGFDGTFYVLDASSYELVFTKKLGNFKLRKVIFNLDKRQALLGYGDGTVRIFDIDNFEETHRLEGHRKDFSVNALAFHPTQNLLITGSRDAHLLLWDTLNNYSLVHKIPAHNYAIYDIQFSPNGSWFATGSMDKTVKVWDAENMKVLQRLHGKIGGHTNSVNKLLWTDHEDNLVTTGDDRTIKVWKINKQA